MSADIQPGTALPWVVDTLRLTPEEWADARDEVGNVILCSKDGMVSDVLACVIGRNREERQERARYIVHAANLYPELLAALERILDDEEVALSRPDYEFAHTALRKARGEPA